MKPIISLNLKVIFLLIFLSVDVKLSAQTINNAADFTISGYNVLPDAGYTFEQISTDTSFHFRKNPLLRSTGRYYWLKVALNNPYPNKENYIIKIPDALRYTLYYYNGVSWLSRTAGLQVADGRRESGTIPFILLPEKLNTLYIKLDLGEAFFLPQYKPHIILEKQVVYNSKKQMVLFSYLLCCIALISFLSYNLYLYMHLKDKVYKYFVVIQLGALFYLTGTQFFVNVIIPLRFIFFKVWPNGFIRIFDLNTFSMHIGVVLIFVGLCLFTRAYLRTDELTPKLGRLLKLLAITYIIAECLTVILVATQLYNYCIIIVNVLTIAVIVTCLTSGILAYRRNVNEAKHFLAAILLPSLVAALVSVSVILHGMPNPLLPAMAILSQILTFAVALVARIKAINDEFNKKAIEAVKLEAANAGAELKRLAIQQENEIMTLNIALEKQRNEHLQLTLEANQRELVGNSLFLQQKNKLLSDLTRQLQDINHQSPEGNTDALRDIQSSLKNNIRLDEEWSKFKLHFEQVHPDFFKNLKTSHPNLTQYELRLCAYFHMNLSTKEIASLLNIAPTSVRQAKSRLLKKINS